MGQIYLEIQEIINRQHLSKAEKEKDPKCILTIEGYFSTGDKDRVDEIVLPSALEKSMPAFMANNPVMCFNHNPDHPVGKVLDYRIDEKGGWFRGGIHGLTQIARDVAALVEAKIIRTMSFMFRPIEGGWDDDEKVYKWHNVEVLELGPVTVPANPAAIITDAKSKGINLHEETIKALSSGEGNAKGVTMDPEVLNKEIEPIRKDVSTIKTSLGELENEIGRIKTLEKQMTDFKESNQRSASEMRGFAERLAGDFKDAVDKFTDAQKASAANLVTYGHQSNMRIGIEKALSLPERRIKSIFGVDAFCGIQDFRRLNDALKLYDDNRCLLDPTYARAGDMLARLKSSKSELVLATLDDFTMLAKDIDTATSGAGSEYLPVGYSANLLAMVKNAQKIAPLFNSFNMPNASTVVPVEGADTLATRATQRTTVVSTKAETTEQTPGSANLTLTAEKLRGRYQWSAEAAYDLIINMIDYIMGKLGEGTARAIDQAIISGDDAAGTGYDTGDIPGSTDARYCWNGLRQMCQSANRVDMSTFSEANINKLRAKMGKYAQSPNQFFWVMSIVGYLLHCLDPDEMPNFRSVDKYGAQATVLTGELGKINGTPLFISEFILDTYNASGIYDGTTKTKTIMAAVNRQAFLLGNYMAPTVEIVRDALYDVYDIVSYWRGDFQPIYTASSEDIIAIGYNIATS